MLAAKARAQTDAAIASHQAQLAQQKAQNEAIHLQVKTQSEIALANVTADLDARLSLLDAHLKAEVAQEAKWYATPPGARRGKGRPCDVHDANSIHKL